MIQRKEIVIFSLFPSFREILYLLMLGFTLGFSRGEGDDFYNNLLTSRME